MMYNELCKMFGIKSVYNRNNIHFCATTIIAIRENQKITVSDMLKFIGYINSFIKTHFDINDRKYSQALLFLKTVNRFFLNQNVKKTSFECMHYTIDVLHEISDITTPNLKQQNAKIALTLNYMIDTVEQMKKKRKV